MAQKAIVTLVTGERYERNFRRHCYDNWKAYAERHGLDLVVVDELPDRSPRGLGRSPAWQKCLVLAGQSLRGYEQVAWWLRHCY